jgi:arylsulfatase A-like enzyme
MKDRPNLVFLLADQLGARYLPLYAQAQIETPNIDRLAAEGVTLDQCVSTCPVCTPYRAMLLTGRHPQTTGMIINSTRTRYSEIGMGDVFAAAGYRTGYIGKWHLHTGAWPANNVPDWVPRGRSRLGFDYWRGYNQHMVYYNGFVHSPDRDFDVIRWNGYETEGEFAFAEEFLDSCGDQPFCLFLSPQQPHAGMGVDGSAKFMAPERFYARVPENPPFPANAPETIDPGDPADPQSLSGTLRNYLAMILSIDEMIGKVLDRLEAMGELDNTLFVFTSDHGNQGCAHTERFWNKKSPYEESLHVPCVMRLPGTFAPGSRCDALTAPVDFLPSLCTLCGVPVPRTVEGADLSAAWRGAAEAPAQDALFCMNFGGRTDWYEDGNEWRGVRTRDWQYTRWLDGRTELYDLNDDPLQRTNLAGEPAHAATRQELDARLKALQRQRGDELLPGSSYADWVDEQRRVVRNAYGPLSHPESEPDWSLLNQDKSISS